MGDQIIAKITEAACQLRDRDSKLYTCSPPLSRGLYVMSHYLVPSMYLSILDNLQIIKR